MDDQSNQPPIRLRPASIDDDCVTALQWYRDPEVLRFSEGPGTECYDLETVKAMYKYLDSIGQLFIIEVREGGEWVPIGDVTLSRETIPIVIGDPVYRSRGIGTRVIRQLIEMARKEHWTELKVKKVYTFNGDPTACSPDSGLRSPAKESTKTGTGTEVIDWKSDRIRRQPEELMGSCLLRDPCEEARCACSSEKNIIA
jgi:GNAT superfamily N-acetyltransferase